MGDSSGSFSDDRPEQQLEPMTQTPPDTNILDKLARHFSFHRETDTGTRSRSISLGNSLHDQKLTVTDRRGSMVEDAIKLIQKWDQNPTDASPEFRSRAVSFSTVSEIQSHGSNSPAQTQRTPEKRTERSPSSSWTPPAGQTTGMEMLTSVFPTMTNLTDRRWQDPIPVNQVRVTDAIEVQPKHRAPPPQSSPWTPPIGQTTGLGMLTSVFPTLSYLTDRRWQNPIPVNQVRITDPIEIQAKAHRASAAQSEPRCTWSGQLPMKQHKNPIYSPKVFLGGVPFDISDGQLIEAFAAYGTIRVQWPPNRQSVNQQENRQQKCGYVYVIFEHDKNVKALLQACTHDYTRAVLRYFFALTTRRTKAKDVQIIPWIIADSNYVKSPAQRLDTQKTVFVGALHGMLTAEGLAAVMHDLFGGVAYVGIDTDKFKYPIGSARVTFNNQRSYMKAVQAEFVDIKAHFNKKIQIDPYIDAALCSTCNLQQGPIFCRDPQCFRYFCRCCWQWVHSAPELDKHKPLMRYRRE